MTDEAAVAEVRHLHPATLAAQTLRLLPQMAAAGAGYAALVEQQGLGGIAFFAAAAALVGAGIALLGWLRFRYSVAPSEIVIESGVLHRQRRIIPFRRVQDIAIERGPLARLLGTARVRIETGGSASDEGDLDMIGLAEAEELRDRVRRGGGRSQPEASAPVSEPVLYALPFARLILSGLFNFSLLFLAGIFAVLEYLQRFGLFDWQEAFTPQQAEAAAGMVTATRAAMFAIALLLLGMVSGVVRTVARDFGFRLTRAEAGLRRQRGLFTLSEVVIPRKRIQVALIDSGLVARAFGWARLSFQTLGADRREGGVQVAAPFAREAEILPILAEPDFPAPPPAEAFVRTPARSVVRQTAPPLTGAVLAAGFAAEVDPRGWAAAAVLAIVAAGGALRWLRHRHAVEGGTLFVVAGLFRRRLWIVPLDRMQTLFVTQGPLQRRLGLASVLVDTAGASSFGEPEIVDLDRADAQALSERLLLFFRGRA